VLFRVISGDHAGSSIPHVHADIGSGEVIVELVAGGVRLSNAHLASIRGRVTRNEVRVVLRTASEYYDDLFALWEESQP
jgi:Domain of unknown function (DUF4160)